VCVDNLVLGGIDDGVGDKAGASDEICHKQLGHGRALVALAGADEAVIVELHEAEAGISGHVSAIEAAEAVYGDGLGTVLFHQLEHSQMNFGGFFDVLARGLDDFCGVAHPAVGALGGLGQVGFLVSLVELLEGDGGNLCAVLGFDFGIGISAHDEDGRAAQLFYAFETFDGVDEVVEVRGGHGDYFVALPSDPGIAGEELAGPSVEVVGDNHRLPGCGYCLGYLAPETACHVKQVAVDLAV
jgi:hypothetical protein